MFDGVAETDTAVILSELKDSYRFSETVPPGLSRGPRQFAQRKGDLTP